MEKYRVKREENPLCFCEYYNKNNERTHILFCCCNCEAFDQTCTYILCQRNRKESDKKSFMKLVDETLDDILDRIRIPSPNGAIKVNTDLLVSLISIFFYISIGTINFIFSLITLMAIPTLLYIRYFQLRFYKSKSEKTRNQIAYYMTLVSLITVFILYNMYLKYEISEISYTIHNYLFFLVILFHVLLHYSNPGYLVSKNSQDERTSRYCDKCQINKQEKISHCPICEKCIFNRDHHCFWLDNCIGYLNHKIFLIYLILLFLLFIYSEFIIFTHFSSIKESESLIECLFNDYYKNFSRSLMSLLFLQLISLTLYSALILMQQILLISIGYTQYEMFKYSQKNKNFALLSFLCGNLSFKLFFKNMIKFLFQFRNKKSLLKLFSMNEKLRVNDSV